MPRPKPKAGRYLVELRERAKLEPKQVLARLRKDFGSIPPANFSRWEKGQRHCPVNVQYHLAKIYDVPFLEMLRRTEGIPEDPITEKDAALTGTVASRASESVDFPATSPDKEVQMPRGELLHALVNRIVERFDDEVVHRVELILIDTFTHLSAGRERRHPTKEGGP